METQEISILGGTVIIGGTARERGDKRDPYDGLLLPDKWFWRRKVLEDLEKVPAQLTQLKYDKIGA